MIWPCFSLIIAGDTTAAGKKHGFFAKFCLFCGFSMIETVFPAEKWG